MSEGVCVLLLTIAHCALRICLSTGPAMLNMSKEEARSWINSRISDWERAVKKAQGINASTYCRANLTGALDLDLFAPGTPS